jgi:curved DNA-binding protein CbpA
MPEPVFRGDPYAVLDVQPGATPAQIKRRWRELAREHHPDTAASAGDSTAEADRRTTRMARINAAYDLLRDPIRRAKYDSSPQGRRTRTDGFSGGPQGDGEYSGATEDDGGPGGPPPPPRTRPVTARFDTTAAFHKRNATTSKGKPTLRGHPPTDRRAGVGRDLRASTPTGPVRTRVSSSRIPLPTLEEARGTELEFGRFHGRTLGEVAEMEPTYVDWIAKTITRDRDLVMRARVIQTDMDERGIDRPVRAAHAGFGSSGGPDG